ncbi:anti-sigma factor [Janthinobacterium sp. BJB1]|nr:anti-sigma factor [Janthinobacterium sp. GW458P]MBE3024749.1 anti-sigma factor [Janthinobacterium sp. GW458P]PHV17950.1 anti-sigma factor [Janthinobacterium sp. BJB303]PJC99840.1 anti-sigma factor [Janthinobacterium sp. BJB1]
MECTESRDRMSAFADGELDALAARQLTRHLAHCPDCAQACAQLLALRAAVRQHGTRHAAPASLHQQIRQALLGEGSAAKEVPRRRKWAQLPWAWINLGVAGASTAAFAVTLALYLSVPSDAERLDQEIVASHFRSLMPEHLADVASSDQHTVKPWFSGRLDFSPPVVDLAQAGFPLIGGRLDYIKQRPVAALAYRRHQHVLNLYVWPDQAQRDASPRLTVRQGYHLIRWSRSGMQYRLISDLNVPELMDFERRLTAQIDQDGLP